MRPLALLFSLCVLIPLVTHATEAGKALPLFNGRDLSGWNYITPDKTTAITDVCHVAPDGVIAIAGKPVGYLQTTQSYKNYRLHAEWRWPEKPGNSGVLLHIASGPIDRNTWPLSIQVQTKVQSVGDLLPMGGAKFAETLTSEPKAAVPLRARQGADSEKPAGEWNACDILCRDGVVEVSLNGVIRNQVSGCSPESGHIGFQLEGIPFELRRVTIEPL